jgi:NTE family protein
MAVKITVTRKRKEKNVLVLQGGGALGAYQAGAYEAMAAAGHVPEWIAGMSIGAINGAIIAGNPPEKRVQRLREFWERVSSLLIATPFLNDDNSRKVFGEASAAFVATTGVPGFFEPRFPPAVFMPRGSPSATSVYDTAPLLGTLHELVDFDLLNSGAVRLSVGAANVRTANLKFFDTAEQEVRAEHIMASAALPPGFPPVIIDEEPYWDGALVSNTPLHHVLEGGGPRPDMCIFQLDLFSAEGPVPESVFDIAQREKEIRYSSRTRLNTDISRDLQEMRRAIRRLRAHIPDELRKHPDWKQLDSISCDAAITIVHLIHRRAAYWTQSNDYEFSRYTMEEHWRAGRADVEHTFNHPAWKKRAPPKEGVTVLDLTREEAPGHAQPASTGAVS